MAEVLEDNRQLGATVHAQQLQFQQLKTNFERALSEAQVHMTLHVCLCLLCELCIFNLAA